MSPECALPAVAESAETAVFHAALTRELMLSLANDYGSDNLDPDRPDMRARGRRSWGAWARRCANRLLPRGVRLVSRRNIEWAASKIASIEEYLPGLASLYSNLADATSRTTMVRVVAYRLLGCTKVKLPRNSPRYWAARRDLQVLADRTDSLSTDFLGARWTLHRFDLRTMGIPVQLYATLAGALTIFVLKQYEYGASTPPVRVEQGDVVIDAGGCWGDTALAFAAAAGAAGHVYAFEFVPSNLEFLSRNLEMNPALRDRIEVVEHPLWSETGVVFHCNNNGPASRVSREPFDGARFTATSSSIDAFVPSRDLPRVDFIKMDIEGAEPFALEGALETVKRYRPKLAISLYHSWHDFVEVPRMLAELDLNYRFYLDHFTIHHEETVLYAQPAQGV